jgi:hypothetical protein
MSPGIAELWRRLSRVFHAALWERPNLRRRWALRWRTETTVREVAEEMGWLAAGDLDQIIPIRDLAVTVRRAVLDEFAEGVDTAKVLEKDAREQPMFGISPQVARMLDWLIRHLPATADAVIGEITGETERRFGISRDVVKGSLGTALALDGSLGDKAYESYLDRLFPKESGAKGARRR